MRGCRGSGVWHLCTGWVAAGEASVILPARRLCLCSPTDRMDNPSNSVTEPLMAERRSLCGILEFCNICGGVRRHLPWHKAPILHSNTAGIAVPNPTVMPPKTYSVQIGEIQGVGFGPGGICGRPAFATSYPPPFLPSSAPPSLPSATAHAYETDHMYPIYTFAVLEVVKLGLFQNSRTFVAEPPARAVAFPPFPAQRRRLSSLQQC